jgi:iron complex transport system substrate-binding protein
MKKVLILLLSVIMILSLSACGSTSASESSENTETKVIIDSLGREVAIPNKIEKIGSLGITRLLSYMDAGDLIVGVIDMDTQTQLGRVYTYVHPEYADIPVIAQGGSGGIVPFDEEIIKAQPDVIFVVSDYSNPDELQEKIGIPVVAIEMPWLFDGTMEESLTIIGEILGKEERSKEINDYMSKTQDDLNDRTKDIKADDKPSVYTGGLNYAGKHGFDGTSAKYGPFDAVNANNVADETGQDGPYTVDLEQIIEWNPNLIFLNPENMDLINKQYSDNPDLFNSLDAVKNKQIYTQLSYVNNYANITIALADSYYNGTVLYPEEFKDIDMAKKSDEIFNFLLGKEIYSDFVNAGLGFEPLVIGE